MSLRLSEAKQFPTFCTTILHVNALRLSYPQLRRGIARHAPIATRRKAYGAHLRPVGHRGTFELLVEEATQKCYQPFLDGLGGILVLEGTARHEEKTSRTEAETHEVIQEEVVQLVRTNEVLGLLRDVALRVGRK